MPPKNHSSVDSKAFIPQEKELVFDIDMTDYDDVRTCCEGANICNNCWRFMCVAVKVIDKSMRQDFGYKNLLWVFSGRRGVHWWICDESTRKLNNEARTAIANYLTVHVGNEMTSATARVEAPLHPAIMRAKDILSEDFTEIMMGGQNILSVEKQREKLINMMPTPDTKELLKRNWERHTDYEDPENSVNLWNIFWKITTDSDNKTFKKSRTDFVGSAMFTFLYPRIDANVSKGINHLLKSPFCVHPKTGKVCVPFDPEKVDEFNPWDCPTLSKSLKEYDELVKHRDSNPSTTTQVIPCLQESIQVFNKFLRGLKEDYTQRVVREKKLAKNNVSSMEVESAF